MRFLVLGPLEVLGEDGRPVPIRGSKERLVLVDLIAHAGRVRSVDALIEDLWGDVAPRTAEKTLASYVSRLRRALEGQGGSGRALIQTRGGGYALEPNRHEIVASCARREEARSW